MCFRSGTELLLYMCYLTENRLRLEPCEMTVGNSIPVQDEDLHTLPYKIGVGASSRHCIGSSRRSECEVGAPVVGTPKHKRRSAGASGASGASGPSGGVRALQRYFAPTPQAPTLRHRRSKCQSAAASVLSMASERFNQGSTFTQLHVIFWNTI